jgi:hypothetical protein
VARVTARVTTRADDLFVKLSFGTAVVVILSLLPAGAVAGPGFVDPPRAEPDPGRVWLVPPVDSAVVRRFENPDGPYGPGHRGIDYFAVPGTAVRAAGSGRVTFAGPVGSTTAVTITHRGEMETTYSSLSEVLVGEGDYVTQSEWVGRSGSPHPGVEIDGVSYGRSGGLHFGVKVAGAYVDPLLYLGPLDVSGAVHLAPLVDPGQPRWWGAGSHLDDECRARAELAPSPPAPNDNLVVVVPGIATSTADAPVADVPAVVGYRPEDTYLFSYRGSDGPRLHRPFEAGDSYGDLRAAAGRLATMLIRVARRHPGRDVDLIAHSQGGVVATAMLENALVAWQPGVPRIDHLVTFASPHRGAPIADTVADLESKTFTGGWVLDQMSKWSVGPDPRSRAVANLATDSELITQLAGHDVLFGTQVLSLAAANDVIIPAPRTAYEGGDNAVVPPPGIFGHREILESRSALGLAHAFLGDAGNACKSAWDHWAGIAGGGVEAAHRAVPEIYARIEDRMMARAGKLITAWPGRRGKR